MNVLILSLSTVYVWNSTSSSSSSSFSIPSTWKYFSSHQHTLPVRRYSTPFTLATKTDNFSDSFHLTDTFIGISNLPCTDGADIGFSLGTSVSNLAPFPIENQIYRENSLVTWPFQRRQICRKGYYALSWTLFYVQDKVSS